MTKQLLASAALLFPLLASADTLVLKNGNRFRGTFNTGNSTQISFTEYSGDRQTINLLDVQEIRFGNDREGNLGPGPVNSGFGRNSQPIDDQRGLVRQPNSVALEDFDRIQADLRGAMDNNNLSDSQRQRLEDNSATLQSASQQFRDGRTIDQRNVRSALDSIRTAASRMRREDRDILNEDIRRVSASMNAPPLTGRQYE